MSEVKTINGREYTFKKYGLKQDMDIKDRSIIADVTNQKESVKSGTMQGLVVFYSLAGGLKHNDTGAELEITEDNFYEHFPPSDINEAFSICNELNGVSAAEKNV